MAVPMKGKDGMVVGEWRVEPLNKTINNITYTSSHTPYNNNGDPWPLTHSGMYLKLSRGETKQHFTSNGPSRPDLCSLSFFIDTSILMQVSCRPWLPGHQHLLGKAVFPWIPISLIHLFCFDRSDLLAGLVVSGHTGARPSARLQQAASMEIQFFHFCWTGPGVPQTPLPAVSVTDTESEGPTTPTVIFSKIQHKFRHAEIEFKRAQSRPGRGRRTTCPEASKQGG